MSNLASVMFALSVYMYVHCVCVCVYIHIHIYYVCVYTLCMYALCVYLTFAESTESKLQLYNPSSPNSSSSWEQYIILHNQRRNKDSGNLDIIVRQLSNA